MTTRELLFGAAWNHFFQKEPTAKKRDCALMGAQAEERFAIGSSQESASRTEIEYKCTASKCMRWMSTSQGVGFCLATIPAETAHLIFSGAAGLNESQPAALSNTEAQGR